MTVTIKCDWCKCLIEPGQGFIQETTQRMIMVSDGWNGVGEEEVKHFHEQANEGTPTCYDRSRL